MRSTEGINSFTNVNDKFTQNNVRQHLKINSQWIKIHRVIYLILKINILSSESGTRVEEFLVQMLNLL